MGRKTKVDLLPDCIKEKVISIIAEYRHGEALFLCNKLIKDHGLPDRFKLTKSSLSRYRIDKMHM